MVGTSSGGWLGQWALIIGTLLLVLGFWRDIRKQTIAGSLPTDFTNTLMGRVETLEEDLKEEKQAREAYTRSTRNWYYAMVQAHGRGEELPPPPPDWP